MSILVNTQTPGLGSASYIMGKLHNLGIRDIQLMFDKQVKMWAVVQVKGVSSNIIMPDKYNEQEPYILWWCKSETTGRFREPNDEDLMNIVTVVKRAPEIWAQGEKRADKFDALDAEKDRKHQEKFKDMIHDISKPMKKAIKEGKL